jgi:hypothetical protein
MHSLLLVCSGSEGIAPMGHSRRHFMHLLQASFTWRLNIPQRETMLSNPPSGHMLRHQNRSAKTVSDKITAKKTSVMRFM